MAKSKEKILFLITKATYGGAQRYVYDLATHLPKDEFDIVVAYGQAGQLSEDLKSAGITAYHVRTLGRDISPIDDVKSFFAILKGIRKGQPDVVHLNSSKAAALGALAARIAGVPKIIFTVHGWPFGEKRNVITKMLIWKISWLTALLSHRVICVSDYDLRVAQHMPFVGNKAVRIYNGIDTHIQFGSGDIIRKAFPVGAKITGTIGELNKNKNQQALVKEAKNNSGMYVAIVGEGEERSNLATKIKEYALENRVKLFGFIPAAEAFKGFDVFALPSIKEGLPYVLIEAKLAGLSIVANRVGGVSEILDAKDMSEFSLEKMTAQTITLYR
jgi:glycosyltransferase involved in cell wall biosynthesis